MTTIFAALATIYNSAAQCAAALGMSRQAYSQAAKRRRLSDAAAIRAAALLNTDPGQTLLANATGKDIAAPKIHAAGHPSPQIQGAKNPPQPQADNDKNGAPTTNYAWCNVPKKMADSAKCRKHHQNPSGIISAVRKIVAHTLPLSKKRQFEIECVEWMLCVPKIPPDSPRFAHYFSRWLVPEKIASAKERGTFSYTVKDCPTYSPSMLDYIQSGIDEYNKFTGRDVNLQPLKTQSKNVVKLSPKAA